MPTPDPGFAHWRNLRQTADTARIDAELDLIETERIALEQLMIDADEWASANGIDMGVFVRGERLA